MHTELTIPAFAFLGAFFVALLAAAYLPTEYFALLSLPTTRHFVLVLVFLVVLVAIAFAYNFMLRFSFKRFVVGISFAILGIVAATMQSAYGIGILPTSFVLTNEHIELMIVNEPMLDPTVGAIASVVMLALVCVLAFFFYKLEEIAALRSG